MSDIKSYYNPWEESDLEELDSDYAYHSDDSDDEEDAAPRSKRRKGVVAVAEENDEEIHDRTNTMVAPSSHSEGTTDSDDVECLDSCWDVMFSRMQRFHERHGHCLVVVKVIYSPQFCRQESLRRAHYKEARSLGRWVKTQRRRHKAMNAEQKLRLENLGFIWNVPEHVWHTMWARLVAYKDIHGDCNVPNAYGDDPKLAKLGKWVDKQRYLQKKGHMSDDRKETLDRIGFVWSPQQDLWRTHFDRLDAYKDKHGDCNVLKAHGDDQTLGLWVHTQRMLQKKGEMNDDRKNALDGIEFVWSPHEDSWDTHFERLVAYKGQHGDCNVPSRYRGDLKLGVWVDKQRGLQRKSKLSEKRKEKLRVIGFVWSPQQDLWRTNFDRLDAYKDIHGDCNVPRRYGGDLKLGRWVIKQRGLQRKSKLREERKEKLHAIGFVWNLS
jgi:hypothetical protein